MTSLRLNLLVAVVAFLAGAGGMYALEASKRTEAVGEAKVYHDQLAAALDSLEQSRSAQAAVDARARAQIDSADTRRAAAEARATAAAQRRPSVIERVVERAGADSAAVRIGVTEVADSIVANEVVPLKAALAATDAIAISLRAQLGARDRVNADLTAALEVSQDETAALRRALPGWISRNGPRLAIPLAVAAGWYARGALGR